MTKKKIIIGVVVILVLGLAYFAISPLFRNVEVNDPLPPDMKLSPPIVKDIEETPQNDFVIQSDSAKQAPQSDSENDSVEQTPQSDSVDVEQAITETTAMEDPVQDTPPSPSPKTFPVTGTFGHPAEGTVRVIETTEGTVIRYENFKTINGPLLHVYLSKDLKAKDFVDLGAIKGTSGNINYPVPADVDISEYKYVLYWCVPFRVLFNSAEIN